MSARKAKARSSSERARERAAPRRAPAQRGAASLHGNAPDSSRVAVLLIDVINDMEFPGGEQLARRSRAIIPRLVTLRERARRANVPIVYANDNFGRWRSDFSAQVEHCLNDGVRGRALAAELKPGPEDYFVLKPKHSAFYQTCLELLLEHLGVTTLILAGVTTDSCVTFTASDAYLRGYALRVVSDGCAAIDARLHRDALAHLERSLRAELSTASRVSLRSGSMRRGAPRTVSSG